MDTGFAVLAVLIVLYAVLATKLGNWSITMPLVFVAVGVALGPGGFGLLDFSPEAERVRRLTEITLALLLFADASTLSLAQVRDDSGPPLRLLTIGLLGTIIIGAVAGILVLPAEGLAFAGLLGAMLAPTDAALGLPIFNNPRVPVRIRRALNIESGLNDGIATPFVLLFLGFVAATETGGAEGHWLTSALTEIVLAVVAGAIIGLAGGWLLRQAADRGWTSKGSLALATLGLALASYFGSLAIGGNGFIAAFVGGIVLSWASQGRFAEETEFTEGAGTFLSLLVWVIFGAVLVTPVLGFTMGWRPILYAVLSLTLVRMLPVALAMAGTGFRRDTLAIMGWFGPRGLASVVFTLIALTRFQDAGRAPDTLIAAATWTILLSVLAHGLSAVPLSTWYSKRLAAATERPLELMELPELKQRRQLLATQSRAHVGAAQITPSGKI